MKFHEFYCDVCFSFLTGTFIINKLCMFESFFVFDADGYAADHATFLDFLALLKAVQVEESHHLLQKSS